MGIRFQSHLQTYELRTRHELELGDVPRSFSDVLSARSFLQSRMHDPFAMQALRRMAAQRLWGHSLYRCNDQEVVQRLAQELATGRLVLIPVHRLRPSAAGAPQAPLAPAAPDAPQPAQPVAPSEPPTEPEEPEAAPVIVATSWIAFQVVDDATGAPIPGVDLRVRQPDGHIGLYTTNADGFVRLEDLSPGTCDLTEVATGDTLAVASFT